MSKTPAWTRKEGKNKKGWLNKKWVASYRKSNPWSKLRTWIKNPWSASKWEKVRRARWATRFYTNPKWPLQKNWEPTRLAKMATAWGTRIPKTVSEAKKIAARWRKILERHKQQKK